ncbi:MAG: hypothetical protein NTV39_00110 [Candidatus Saccharibacteria bacterium]|nr:hypothetical protein [Candidatus Saccharibacteria bacterium]
MLHNNIRKNKPDKKTPSRFRTILLLLLIFSYSVAAVPIFRNTEASAAANKYALMKPEDQIKSHIYYYALGQCMLNSKLADISNVTGFSAYHHIAEDNAKSGNWWWGDPIAWDPAQVNPKVNTFVGPYMDGVVDGVDNGAVDCNNSALVTGALSLWGLDATTVLCNSGFQRQDMGKNQSIADCIRGTGRSFESRTNNYTVMSNMFLNYVTAQVGEPGLTKAQTYIFYRHTLNQSCIPGIDSTAPSNQAVANDNPNGYNGVKWVDLSANPFKIITGSYIGPSSIQSGDTINLRVGSTLHNDIMTCQSIVTEMNKFAQDFLIWAKTNPAAAKSLSTNVGLKPNDSGNGGDDNSCGAQVSGIGWIICPVLSSLTKLDDGMWKLVRNLLNVNPIDQSGTFYQAWGSIRSIANAVFVLFFLVIIFSQLTGAGITNYGVKKMLPKIIVAAILVNISFLIIQLAVDLANIIGSSLYNFIVGLAPTYTVDWGSAFNMLEGGVAALTGAVVAVAAAGGPTALFFIMLGLALIAALGLITAVLTLIFRQAAIIILALLAPLAFVAYLLPNTESWFKKWRGLLLSMLIMYPMAAIIFAGAQFAAATIIGKGTDFWNIMIGLTMMALPLFSLPFIARQGGAILSRVNGALAGVAKRANQPIQSWSKSHADAAAAEYRADNGGRLRHGFGRYSPARGLSRAWAGGRENREARTAAAKDEFKSQLNNNQVRGMTGRRIDGDATAIRAAAAKESLKIDSERATTGMINQNPAVNARHGGTSLNERGYEAAGEKKIAEQHRDESLENNRGFDELRKNIDHSKGRADTAANKAKQRVEEDPTTLQVRAITKSSAESLENAEAHTKSVIETASTKINPDNPDITPIEVEALGGIDDTTRANLVTNKSERKIEASAAGQAIAAQNQEIADILLSSSAPGSAAVRAAGVAGTAGVARVQASATSELAKFRQDNVNAAMTLFADQGYSSDPTVRGKTPDQYSDLLKVATGGRLRGRKATDPVTGVETETPGSEPTEEQQEAAMQLIFNTGSADAISTIYNRLAKLPDTSDEEHRTKLKLEQSFARIASAGKKPKSIRGGIVGRLSSGGVGPASTVEVLPDLTPFQSIAFEILAKGKLAAESFAETDQEELRIWSETLTLPGVRDRFAFTDPGKESDADPDRVVETSIVNAINSALTDPLVAKDVSPEKRTEMYKILEAFNRNALVEELKEKEKKGRTST